MENDFLESFSRKVGECARTAIEESVPQMLTDIQVAVAAARGMGEDPISTGATELQAVLKVDLSMPYDGKGLVQVRSLSWSRKHVRCIKGFDGEMVDMHQPELDFAPAESEPPTGQPVLPQNEVDLYVAGASWLCEEFCITNYPEKLQSMRNWVETHPDLTVWCFGFRGRGPWGTKVGSLYSKFVHDNGNTIKSRLYANVFGYMNAADSDGKWVDILDDKGRLTESGAKAIELVLMRKDKCLIVYGPGGQLVESRWDKAIEGLPPAFSVVV